MQGSSLESDLGNCDNWGRANNRRGDFMQLKEVSKEWGFLPSWDPLTKLNTSFGLWEGIAKELPKLLVSDRLRTVLDQMPVLDADRLDQDQCERVMLLLSFLGHGYVWCDSLRWYPKTRQVAKRESGS